MRILYLTDTYAWNVYGSKRSIYEEMLEIGHDMILIDRKRINDLVALDRKYNPDFIWIAHSWATFPSDAESLRYKVVLFGFSDPYKFSEQKLSFCSTYITNHYPTYLQYKDQLRCIYNPVACDLRFHRVIDLPKTLDISIIGTGFHSRFKNKQSRIEIVESLRARWRVNTYGTGWPKHPHNRPFVEGNKFLRVINSSRMGLDIQDETSPLAHRLFEYPACGRPIITRDREELRLHFTEHEMPTYRSEEDLISKLEYYLSNKTELDQLAERAYRRVRREHDIRNRIAHILKELDPSKNSSKYQT